MNETYTPLNPLEGRTPEEIKQMYPFGYHVFPDGEVYGRDPLQEANAGLDVDPVEIDEALRLIEDDRLREDEETFGQL